VGDDIAMIMFSEQEHLAGIFRDFRRNGLTLLNELGFNLDRIERTSRTI
jgi:hypothetical protein